MTRELTPIACYADQPPVPWANGAGSTVELVSLAESAALTPGLPAWRLSIATLERPAAFSALPGMRRIFRPIGADVVLDIDGEHFALADGQACVFDGAAVTALIALPGPCHAVNLMITAAEAVVASAGCPPEPVVDGTFLLTLGESRLGPGFTLLRAAAPAPGGTSDCDGVPVLRF
ncbi:HutD family protein [Brevibacterium luteolum]|uniref:HutD family protein n=1 Tax=Brevibacterium luteolum TaxID=199591 RepID=UPI001C2378C0|nr:HutD family protein [Brevibacterium luteolum]MBU8577293.1 HutD family protein [Brevibacterium luteolum]